jgi:enamine deaminase RidA (YjgF/YER057c/UK114 family)
MRAGSWTSVALIAASVVLGQACGVAHAADKQAIYADESTRDADWHQGWADAVVAGDLVFVSGVVAGDKGGIEAGFDRVFARIASTLEKAGASLDDVVDLTVYLTDVDTQLEPLTRARLRHMRPPYAASTVVQVERLIPPDGIAEIRATARR